METAHIKDRLVDYLDGTLEAYQREEVRAHLESCATCSQELEELKTILSAFKNEAMERPSASLRTNFYALVEKEKELDTKVLPLQVGKGRKTKEWAMGGVRMAAGVALLVGAYFFGKYQEGNTNMEQIGNLRAETLEVRQTAMLSLMENASASKRIQGVNFITEQDKLDTEIIGALADRMLYDENTNVRLTAVEALGKFTSFGQVKDAFIKALKTEKDPTVQIAIIHTLVRIQEKRAIAPMRDLLDQEDTQPFVKEQIESLIPSII
tara:strand:+ start:22374 stop:23171 length:798 start_codon:yes stop_codon:yes gene_type:complete